MSQKLVKIMLRQVLPVLAGALGTYLATGFPEVYAAVCGV